MGETGELIGMCSKRYGALLDDQEAPNGTERFVISSVGSSRTRTRPFH